MIKDIVVHLTGSQEDEVRLCFADALAGIFGAHLTGLLVHLEPELLAVPDPMYADVLQSMVDESASMTRQHKSVLSARFERFAVANDLRIISGTRGTIGDALATEARASDLFVATRPHGDPGGDYRVEEAVLFGSGGPCLFLPPKKPTLAEIGSVLVAWKTRREAARAIKDAIPFLKKAKRVTLAIVTDEAEQASNTASGADIGRYLSRHGIKAEIKELAGWHSAADALLNEIASSGPDLVVAGAYGHSRLQQRLLGGVTRALLSKCEVPVLMSR
ncbi:universal stress protein [Devosia naphthalenivorans]|uniref:universal stress protein n=1 Tax=Devosia naphthalenivorans TaxID=2082392 RepID=UPI000D3D5AC7|nr:universal stress protein [Devosia naphthalenivorans]